jgi:hypothetical protein
MRRGATSQTIAAMTIIATTTMIAMSHPLSPVVGLVVDVAACVVGGVIAAI